MEPNYHWQTVSHTQIADTQVIGAALLRHCSVTLKSTKFKQLNDTLIDMIKVYKGLR